MGKTICIVCGLLTPLVLYACTPIIPMMYIYMGPAPWGAIARATIFGLMIAVVIKCFVFILKSDFRSWTAVLYVCIANLVSTAFGVGIGGFASNGLFLLIGIILSFVVFQFIAKYFKKLPFFSHINERFLGVILALLFVLSTVSFFISQSLLDSPQSTTMYWIFKLIFTILAIALSFLVTVLVEEWVISDLYNSKYKTKKSFITPVLWANVVAFIIVFALAAVRVIPQRLQAPGFLIGE